MRKYSMARNWYVHKDINTFFIQPHKIYKLLSYFPWNLLFSCNLLCLFVTVVVQYKLYNLALRLLY